MKDPFRTAEASKLLPAGSRIRVTQIGQALGEGFEKRANAESEENPRYFWLEELPRWKAIRMMARCRLLILTSVMEGGANAISEALACSVPVLCSRISGSIGLLGESYPGYFTVGNTDELAELLDRAERDSRFYNSLRRACVERKRLIEPARERDAWRALLEEVANA